MKTEIMKLTNEEKCIYCREYGNLPCDECNKKLEEKKAMSKRLEEILKKHCPSMDNLFLDKQGKEFRQRIFDAMQEYAREVAQASLEIASEKTTEQYVRPITLNYQDIKNLITNPDNILML